MKELVLAALTVWTLTGCISVKTESEIKPIHITMDVNLKVDKELDKAFADENQSKASGRFKEVKALLDRKVAGVTAKALLEAREGATDDERIFIAEENARRMKRFADVAKSSGVQLEAVQKRYARKWLEKTPAGSGVWLQKDDGTWIQK